MNAESGYMSGPHDGPKCACRDDGIRWLKRCGAAAANDHAEAARSAADHVRTSPNTRFTSEYLALALQGGLRTTDASPTNEDLR